MSQSQTTAMVHVPRRTWWDTVRDGVAGATEYVAGTALPAVSTAASATWDATSRGASSAGSSIASGATSAWDGMGDLASAAQQGWTKGRTRQ